MRSDLPRDLVLAIATSTRGIAYALFEAPLAPVDWGTKDTQTNAKNAEALKIAAELIERLQPDVLVLNEYPKPNDGRRARIARLRRLIASYAGSQSIDVAQFSRRDIKVAFAPYGAATRHEIAQLIAGHIPAFSFRLPPKRKLWMTEDRRMALFDAVALALTHFSQRGLLSEGELRSSIR